LDVYEEEGIVEMAAKKGVHLRKRLEEMKDKYEEIGDVRGFGMMQAIELVEDRKSKVPACRLRDKVDELCMKRGLITLGCGKSGIRVIPPIITPIEQIDAGLDVLEGAIGEATRK
jgi:4-aminobutyrate aminotransferase